MGNDLKVTVISENAKRNTAMIVVHYTINGVKRSETRHCREMRGYVLDADKASLTVLALVSAQLCHEIDALNHELGNKAKKAEPYTPNLWFHYQRGDGNGAAYGEHITGEVANARRNIGALADEAEPLRLQVQVRREEQRQKRQVIAVALLAAAAGY